jgi:hypothetical protein
VILTANIGFWVSLVGEGFTTNTSSRSTTPTNLENITTVDAHAFLSGLALKLTLAMMATMAEWRYCSAKFMDPEPCVNEFATTRIERR